MISCKILKCFPTFVTRKNAKDSCKIFEKIGLLVNFKFAAFRQLIYLQTFFEAFSVYVKGQIICKHRLTGSKNVLLHYTNSFIH